MREIIIRRPKRMECCAVKFIVELNGARLDKLRNGEHIEFTVDDGPQTICVRGGFLSGLKLRDTLAIPAGRHSYELQVDLPSTGSSYQPLLRPCKGEFLRDDNRLVTIMGVQLTRFLLDEKFRTVLKELSNPRIHLMVLPAEWRIVLFHNNGGGIVYQCEYAKANEGFAGALIGVIDHADLRSPEGRERITNKILDDYAACLPEYERIGKRGLVFKG